METKKVILAKNNAFNDGFIMLSPEILIKLIENNSVLIIKKHFDQLEENEKRWIKKNEANEFPLNDYVISKCDNYNDYFLFKNNYLYYFNYDDADEIRENLELITLLEKNPELKILQREQSEYKVELKIVEIPKDVYYKIQTEDITIENNDSVQEIIVEVLKNPRIWK